MEVPQSMDVYTYTDPYLLLFVGSTRVALYKPPHNSICHIGRYCCLAGQQVSKTRANFPIVS